MKFLLLATFVVFCAASTLYRGKNISFGDDGSIVITSSSSGKRVVITKPTGYSGQKTIDITVSGPNMPTKRIQIDEEQKPYDAEVGGNRYPWSSGNSVEDEQFRGKRSFKKEKSQADFLFEILREYQGPVSDPLFEKLLGKIDKAVRKGEISRQIYDLLVELDQIDNPSSEITGNQINLGGQSIVPGRSVVWYTRVVPQIQGGRVVLIQEQIPLVQGVSQSWGTTRYVNPLLERWLQGQQIYGGTYGGLPSEQLNSGIYGGLQTQQNVLDGILARQQLVDGAPLTLQGQQNIVDEVLARQQLLGGAPLSLQSQQNIVDEALLRQQLLGGVPVSFQTQQNIVDEILARQQLKGGVPLSLQTRQDIIDEVLARQQLRGGVPLSFQGQQNIVDEILTRQQLNGGIPLSLQNQQNNIDEVLTRQQLLGGFNRGYLSRQGLFNQILTPQQLNGGYQTGRGVVGQMLMRQQPIGGVSGSYQIGQNPVEQLMEQQEYNNEVARALQADQEIDNGLLIQQGQQQLQDQLQQEQLQQFSGGVSSGLQSGQSIVGNLLRSQQLNSGVPVRSNILLKEYLSGIQQMPLSQRQSFGTLLGMLRSRPVGYYNQGVKEGYRMRQVQPSIIQNGRGVYMDNMGVPQVVY